MSQLNKNHIIILNYICQKITFHFMAIGFKIVCLILQLHAQYVIFKVIKQQLFNGNAQTSRLALIFNFKLRKGSNK